MAWHTSGDDLGDDRDPHFRFDVVDDDRFGAGQGIRGLVELQAHFPNLVVGHLAHVVGQFRMAQTDSLQAA